MHHTLVLSSIAVTLFSLIGTNNAFMLSSGGVTGSFANRGRFASSTSSTWQPCSPRHVGARGLQQQRTARYYTLGMKANVGQGSYVALVTPMTEYGKVDGDALRRLVRWHVDSGSDGVVALGTTGEASTLSDEERQQVLTISIREASGKIPVIAGTSSGNPSVIIQQTLQAAECGADAVLMATPAYVKPSQRGLIEYYLTVADKGSLPIILYNVPSRTAVDMGTPAVAELAKHPSILGLKDATGDMSRLDPMIEACPNDFLFYSGDDETAMAFLLRGGDGLISVTANVAPREMSELVKACRDRDTNLAEAINSKVLQLHKKLFVQGNPVTVKYALARMGKILNHLRVPLVPMEDQFKAEVDLALEGADLLT